MAEILTIKKVISFLKADLRIAFCWPLSVNATRCQKTVNNIIRVFCFLNGLLLSIALMYTLSCERDMILIMKVGVQLSATLQIPVQIMLFTLQSNQLQAITYKMENYIQQAKTEERNIFQRYVDKCKLFYGITIGWIALTAVAYILGPVMLPQPFPFVIRYPFYVNYQPLNTIIYLHQTIAVYQCHVHVCANVFVALLLWFVAARFEILSHKFRKVTTFSEFMICIKLHQQLLRYAKDVTMVVRYVALSSIGFSTAAVVFSGLTVLSKSPMTVKAQFFTVIASSLVEVFICAWPADYLLRISCDISQAAYYSVWYNKGLAWQKDLLYVVSRSQQPVTVTIPCMLPILSLNYYASYLSTAFSYLTAFRAAFAAEDDL